VSPKDAAALTADVTTWQNGLWAFNPIGLRGRKGSSSRWVEPVNPLVVHQELRFKIPAPVKGQDKQRVVVSLVATDAGDGNQHDYVIWRQPRLVKKGQPDILLRDVRKMTTDDTSQDSTRWGLDPALFGKHPNGKAIDATSLCVRAPSVIEVHLPAGLVSGRELLTTVVLDEETGLQGSAQVEIVGAAPRDKSGLRPSQVTVKYSRVTQVFSEHREISFSRPILISKKSTIRTALESAMDDHRSLFPTVLCYLQVVPVDELHTTTLYYREDDHLERLMLDAAQKSRIDQLWQELRYVSQSALMRVHSTPYASSRRVS